MFTILGLAGCPDQAQVVQYKVPKQQTARTVNPNNRMPPSDGAGKRMLAAIIPGQKQSWFFKITGPDKDVAGEAERFEKFVGTVKIGDEAPPKPKWTLPEKWNEKRNEKPGSDIRYATIAIGTADPPLELSVTVLGTTGELDGYILANINRWRRQLGLQPIDSAEPSDEIRQLKLDGGRQATLVHLVGKPAAGGTARVRPPTAQPNSQLTYDTPDGWKVGQAGGFRKAAFSVTEGERRVEITVIDLRPSGWLANVNRWRGQIKLPPTSAADLNKEVQEIEVDGATSQYITIVGPENAAGRQTIAVVMVLRADKAWFFKLMGDSRLAAREKKRFESFVRSVRFASTRRTP